MADGALALHPADGGPPLMCADPADWLRGQLALFADERLDTPERLRKAGHRHAADFPAMLGHERDDVRELAERVRDLYNRRLAELEDGRRRERRRAGR